MHHMAKQEEKIINLSDFIVPVEDTLVLDIEDVKEFIRRLKEELSWLTIAKEEKKL